MKNLRELTIVVACGIVAFVCLLGWVGDYDYCEQVILHMSQEQYDSVKNMLAERDGSTPSDNEIAHWWAEHNQ